MCRDADLSNLITMQLSIPSTSRFPLRAGQLKPPARLHPVLVPAIGRPRFAAGPETSFGGYHAGPLPLVRSAAALALGLYALSGMLDLPVPTGVAGWMAAGWIWVIRYAIFFLPAVIVGVAAGYTLRRQAAELHASRTRIVTAADCERRRIERNLHDGAQQRLSALAIKLSLASELAEHDVDQARDLLAELRADVRETADELRCLAHGIYPPLLAEQGLDAALSAAARRSALPITVQAGPLGRYPAETEATVYFCCLEAIQNACKHAGNEATLGLRVREADGVLTFEVTDDGRGFDASVRGLGAGFVNMEDRLRALRGRMLVESAPGQGTRVSGTLPAGRA
jgi:signal transduction histidine kinase